MRDFEKPTVPNCAMNDDLRQAIEELCEHLYEVIIKCSSGLLRLVIATSDLNAMDQLIEGQNIILTRWVRNLRHYVKSFIFAKYPGENYSACSII